MRRMLLGAVLASAGVLIARAVGLKLGEGFVGTGAEMFDRLPDDLPPKQVMRGVEEIRDQTGRILGVLEERATTSASAAN